MRDWRSELVDRYPDFLRKSVNGLNVALGYPFIEDGWRSIIERAMTRVALAVWGQPAGIVKITEIKEKWGGLRLHWEAGDMPDDAAARVREAIELAEFRSYCTCRQCGSEGRTYEDNGWILTLCPVHERGHAFHNQDEPLLTRYSFAPGGEVKLLTRLRYDRDRDLFVPVQPKS